MTSAFEWIFAESASSQSVSSVDGASASTIIKKYIFKENPSEGDPSATSTDAIRALSESGSDPWQLELFPGKEVADTKWWLAACASHGGYNGPDPVVTGIDARPLAAPFTFEVTVRAEVFWPIQVSDDDNCYEGQYRRFSSASSTRSLKLYRVRDITLTDDTTSDPDEYEVTASPSLDPATGHGSGAGFNFPEWVPK